MNVGMCLNLDVVLAGNRAVGLGVRKEEAPGVVLGIRIRLPTYTTRSVRERERETTFV